jgi:hypothetical protein
MSITPELIRLTFLTLLLLTRVTATAAPHFESNSVSLHSKGPASFPPTYE